MARDSVAAHIRRPRSCPRGERRTAKRSSRRLREAAVVPEEAVTVAVSLDGVMVPMKDAQRAEKRERPRAQGPRAKGPTGLSGGACATLSFYDGAGERLDTLSIARMPEPKKATLKTMLSAELDTVLSRRPDLQVVTVADGAHDNWRYLDTLAPDATAVVDFYHGAEQLKSALDARYGENETLRPPRTSQQLSLRVQDCVSSNDWNTKL